MIPCWLFLGMTSSFTPLWHACQPGVPIPAFQWSRTYLPLALFLWCADIIGRSYSESKSPHIRFLWCCFSWLWAIQKMTLTCHRATAKCHSSFSRLSGTLFTDIRVKIVSSVLCEECTMTAATPPNRPTTKNLQWSQTRLQEQIPDV